MLTHYYITSLKLLAKIAPIIDSRNDSVRYIKGSSDALLRIGDTAVIIAGLKVKISCPFKAVPEGNVLWQRNGLLANILYYMPYQNCGDNDWIR